MGTSFTEEVSSDRLTSYPGVMRAACLPNVTEIGDWLRPYGPYGPKRQTKRLFYFVPIIGFLQTVSGVFYIWFRHQLNISSTACGVFASNNTMLNLSQSVSIWPRNPSRWSFLSKLHLIWFQGHVRRNILWYNRSTKVKGPFGHSGFCLNIGSDLITY